MLTRSTAKWTTPLINYGSDRRSAPRIYWV
jgi:hypothetical protein